MNYTTHTTRLDNTDTGQYLSLSTSYDPDAQAVLYINARPTHADVAYTAQAAQRPGTLASAVLSLQQGQQGHADAIQQLTADLQAQVAEALQGPLAQQFQENFFVQLEAHVEASVAAALDDCKQQLEAHVEASVAAALDDCKQQFEAHVEASVAAAVGGYDEELAHINGQLLAIDEYLQSLWLEPRTDVLPLFSKNQSFKKATKPYFEKLAVYGSAGEWLMRVEVTCRQGSGQGGGQSSGQGGGQSSGEDGNEQESGDDGGEEESRQDGGGQLQVVADSGGQLVASLEGIRNTTWQILQLDVLQRDLPAGAWSLRAQDLEVACFKFVYGSPPDADAPGN
jgi:hypothetical protein